MIGFVYILTNEYMPDVYKVGCTERSPHERAAELSKPTGVPHPFRVLCYIEADDFQSIEREVHQRLSAFRISNNREFFHCGIEYAVRLLFWHPARFSFCEATGVAGDEPLLARLDFGREIVHMMQTENPFAIRSTPNDVVREPIDQTIESCE